MIAGGDNISVTKGVVSRVEPTQYVHGATQLMAIQIDAAINPGNSGGPAIMGSKVAGVAFQNLTGAENIGYVDWNNLINLHITQFRVIHYGSSLVCCVFLLPD